jgi:sensor histidine kinase YesM
VTISRHQLYWLLQIIGWTTFTSISLWFNYATRGSLRLTDFIYGFGMIIIGIAFSNIIRWRFLSHDKRDRGIFTLLKGVFIASIILGWLTVLILYYFSQICDEAILRGFDQLSFIMSSVSFAIIYFVWSLLYFAVYYFRNFKKEEIKTLTYQAQIKEISLSNFKSQLNPHFMFNSLNVIRSLVDEDSSKAKVGITKLSNILRHSLILDKQKLISLEEEMKLVHDYLDLEKMRFEERLVVEEAIPPEAMRFKVPPMMIQTLVENGIKHGISKLVEGGTIHLSAMINEGKLIFSIEHPGEFNPDPDNGHGLKNSKQRLMLIFNGKANLDIMNASNNTVITTLIIPEI